MRVLKEELLKEFWEKHRDAEGPLASWYQRAVREKWPTPLYLKQHHSNARPIKNNRVIFDIKGGTYRLIVRVNYRIGLVEIRFIGTHAEYDRVNAPTV